MSTLHLRHGTGRHIANEVGTSATDANGQRGTTPRAVCPSNRTLGAELLLKRPERIITLTTVQNLSRGISEIE